MSSKGELLDTGSDECRRRQSGAPRTAIAWQDCVVSVDQPERDEGWDWSARQETETQRLDRNWSSLLQELRVTQTGVQLLTGFLLTLPFQQRFTALDSTSTNVYL